MSLKTFLRRFFLGIGITLLVLIIAFAAWSCKNLYVWTHVPMASKQFVSQLPGTILLDTSWGCTHCDAYSPIPKNMLNKTNLQTDYTCEKARSCYPSTDFKNRFINFYLNDKKIPQDSTSWNVMMGYYNKGDFIFKNTKKGNFIVNKKTKQAIPFITEGRDTDIFCWSPDTRYLIYTVQYDTGNETFGDEMFLYFILDTKTQKTYRLFETPEVRQYCLWLPQKVYPKLYVYTHKK